jgi:hypothetical protein
VREELAESAERRFWGDGGEPSGLPLPIRPGGDGASDTQSTRRSVNGGRRSGSGSYPARERRGRSSSSSSSSAMSSSG